MFAERLIEEKKRLGLTTKAIAEMSKMGLSLLSSYTQYIALIPDCQSVQRMDKWVSG